MRVRPAARRGGAAPEQEMLLVDYWIEVPGDPASAARVVFTRPGADSRDEVVAQYAHLPEGPGRDKDLPDPWYGDYGDFVDTLAVIERSTPALVDYVRP